MNLKSESKKRNLSETCNSINLFLETRFHFSEIRQKVLIEIKASATCYNSVKFQVHHRFTSR